MVRADEIADLKAATQKLAKQNEELSNKLAAIEKRQHKVETKVDTKATKATADASSGGNAPLTYEGFAKWQAADLGRRLLDKNDDSTLTFMGITIYGGIDMGVAYQSHGNPLNGYYSPGLEYLATKNNNHPLVSFAPDALSQTNFGIKGVEPIYGDLSAVFNAQMQINPQSGAISDNIRTVTNQNFTPAANQVSGGDSSRAGQLFNNIYAGVSSARFGTLTFGRQNSLELDAVLAYDPMGGSNAFSVIGYQGATAGAGNTENARLDDSLKYRVNYGPVRAAAMYKFGAPGTANAQAIQGQIGFDYMGFSFDGIFSHIDDSVAAAPIGGAIGSPAQAFAADLATSGNGVITATVSDNTAFMAVGKYTYNAFKFYGGYENVQYQNPKSPLYTGQQTIGGYVLDAPNNNAYNIKRDLQVFWTGVKYAFRPDIDITVAYYHEIGSTFGGSNAGSLSGSNLATVGCSSVAAANCAGTLDAVSGLIDYRVTKRFDVYTGVMWSTLRNGFASGGVIGGAPNFSTGNVIGTIDPTVGARFQF